MVVLYLLENCELNKYTFKRISLEQDGNHQMDPDIDIHVEDDMGKTTLSFAKLGTIARMKR